MNVNDAFPRRSGSGAPDIPIPEIVGRLAENIAALCAYLLPSGRREGAEWRCGSVQGEPGKSLGIRLTGAKAGVWSDFADGSKGDPLDLIQACLGLDKGAAVLWAKGWLGIADSASTRPCERRRPPGPQHNEAPRQDNPNRRLALEIWRASHPAPGTLAEDYLRGRGITIPIPHTIRYHPGLKHADTGLELPCLVAAVCNVERKITGIQRTFLTMDGRKAPLNRPRMALGTLTGGAVRLAPTIDRVWLAEGVEDALALMQMMGEPAWAVLGTGGFKTVELPESIKQVILAPDGDDAGQGIIQEAAARLTGQGRDVRAAKMPAGQDWCDLLCDFEEIAANLESDLGLKRKDAEDRARREVILG
ncbi:MAG: toprim domain-containing protein [Proteobacteria bacterium]|nr:toprim domain-containing protein [Pseudomonadota bacterium]